MYCLCSCLHADDDESSEEEESSEEDADNSALFAKILREADEEEDEDEGEGMGSRGFLNGGRRRIRSAVSPLYQVTAVILV